jgi:outer membrane protein TolC
MQSFYFLGLSTLFCFLPMLSAEGRADEISLSECISEAKARSLQVIQSSLNASQSEAAWHEVKSQKLPQLFANAQISATNNLSTQLQDANSFSITAQQKAYPFSQAWLQSDQKETDYHAAQLGRVESEQDVELLIKQLYFDILLDTDVLDNVAQVERVLNELLSTFLPKYSMGRVPSFDIAQVRFAVISLSAQQTVTLAQMKTQKSRLAQLLGRPATAELTLKPIHEVPELPIEYSTLTPKFESNPTFRKLHTQIESSQIGIRAARAAWLPALVTSFQIDYSGDTLNNLSPGWTYTAGLQFPIFNWGQISAQVRQQELASELRETQLGLLRQRSNADFIQARELAQANLANQKKFRNLLPEVHSASLASIDRYRKRATTVLEVASAVNLWLGTFSSERNAYYAYLGSIAQMERLLGASQKVNDEEP